MSTPYIGFSKSTLDCSPQVTEGQAVYCPICHGRHPLECGTGEDGKKIDLLMFYKCGEKLYLGAVDGRLVAGVKADVSGKI